MNDTKQTICIERERLQQARQLDNVSRSLQKTMSELQGIEELQPIPADLADITENWLQQQLDLCTDPIKADKSLTSDERRERLKPWRAISQRASRLVNIVQGILASNGDVVFTIEDGEDGQTHYHISEEQIEAVALQRSTHPVPAEALQHLDFIQAVREKVDALREFERAHNVKRYTIEQLLRMPWFGCLADMWAVGDIFNDHNEKWKNYFPGQKLERNFTTRKDKQ